MKNATARHKKNRSLFSFCVCVFQKGEEPLARFARDAGDDDDDDEEEEDEESEGKTKTGNHTIITLMIVSNSI